MKYISLEFFKMKHRKIFLTAFSLVIVEFLWFFVGVKKTLSPFIPDASQPVWEYLFMCALLLKSLIFPVMIAIIVSRASDMEHKGNTWKLLESCAQTRESIWKAKFLSVFLIITAAQVLELVLVLVFGIYLHIAEPLPVSTVAIYLFGSLAVNTAILLIQQWVSMTTENQLVPIAIGIAGAFIGLFASFLPSGIRYLLIWGYYTNLSPATMGGAPASGQIPAALTHVTLLPIAIALIICVILYIVGRKQFVKSEN